MYWNYERQSCRHLKFSDLPGILLLITFTCRGLWFIQSIFEEVLTQEPDLSTAVGKAYEKSVKRYHGWFIQKAFGVSHTV